MRLRRLWVENYYNLQDVEIHFPDARWNTGTTSVRLFVGLNGSGKSNTLEAIGLIFSYLAMGIAPDFGFEVEYDLAEETVLITNRPGRLDDVRADVVTDIPVVLLVRSAHEQVWHAGHVKRRWADSGKSVLPQRIVGYSGGPTSGLRDALVESVIRYVKTQLSESNIQARPVGMSDADWETYVQSERMELHQRVEAHLDNPTTLFLGARDSMCAALALLAHEGVGGTPDEQRRYLHLRQVVMRSVQLRTDEPLKAFSLRLLGTWAERLTPRRRESLSKLLGLATVIMPIETPELEPNQVGNLPDIYAVFDLDATFRTQSLHEFTPTPYDFFDELLAWTRQGALVDIHLMLKMNSVDSILPESALSDGEFLLLGRYGLLLMMRGVRNAMILLDEPETHYNDRWKADMVRNMRELLSDDSLTNSEGAEVVVATHSAIVLTDVEASQIFLFRRSRSKVEVVQPETPTFGADLSVVVAQLADKDLPVGTFAEEVVEDQLQRFRNQPDELRKLLARVGPGPLRLDILEAIRRAR